MIPQFVEASGKETHIVNAGLPYLRFVYFNRDLFESQHMLPEFV
jgi:hypothetical protein